MQVDRRSYRFFIVTMMRNNVSATDIHKFLVDAWNDEAPSLVTIRRVMREDKEGIWTSMDDSHRSGRPLSASSDFNIQAIREKVEVNSGISICKISFELDIFFRYDS